MHPFESKPKKTWKTLLAQLTPKRHSTTITTPNNGRIRQWDTRPFHERDEGMVYLTKDDDGNWIRISDYLNLPPSPLEAAEEELKTAKQLNKALRAELLKRSRIAEERSRELDGAKVEIGRLRQCVRLLEEELEKSEVKANELLALMESKGHESDEKDSGASDNLNPRECIQSEPHVSAVCTDQATSS